MSDDYGLPARPAPDPVVVALVSSAVEQLIGAAAVAQPDVDDAARRAWRFSGRWWTRPLPMRRHRPWIG